MGPRKLHDADRTWLGEAAIVVSTSTFLLKNCAHTKSERKGQEESGEKFLEDHWIYTQVGGERCSDLILELEKQSLLYIFSGC